MACFALALATTLAQGAGAQDLRFFRIATGGIGGTYFPIGSLIASAISNPPGSRPCEEGGSCGVPGLIAVAQTTQGSVQNIDLIVSSEAESGFAQSDVAYWAFYGDNMFRKEGPRSDLRALARLYPESVHIVVHKFSGIASVADLRGRRVSIGDEGSGTAINAQIVLAAHGLGQGSFEALHYGATPSADKLRAKELDAFVFVGGYPVAAVADLARDVEIALLPLTGAETEELLREHPFFSPITIPAGIYNHVPETPTLSVNAQWIVSARVDADLVYQIVRALWADSTRKLLGRGHPEGQLIRKAQALEGIAIPLHDGAARFYREVGLLQ